MPPSPRDETPDALVIGAGPAGLMAAEELARAGRSVVIADAMPSPARKFLMAGKSGLNLTKVEDPDRFRAAYGEGAGPVPALVEAFGPAEIASWAEGLDQPLFTGSTGRVFPVAMKASPLLRAWLARLDKAGVILRRRWRWTGWHEGTCFETPEGARTLHPHVTILALGGASWRRLGSDGAWVPWLREAGVTVHAFRPANAGLGIDWSPHMAPHHGTPVKGVALDAGGTRHRGEFVVSATGLEGGGIYAVSRAVRDGADLYLDLKPDWPVERVEERLATARGAIGNRLRKGLRLDPVATALLMEFGRPVPRGSGLAALVKRLPVRHAGLAPLDAAISSAGGVAWESVDPSLMLRARPGAFVAGEMLDWEAPTGGYLLTACLATGRHAGRAAAAYLEAQKAARKDPRSLEQSAFPEVDPQIITRRHAMHETLRAAIDKLDAGDWEAAHEASQADPGPEAAWLHAHLHRVEGDEANAAYWYRRAGRDPFPGTVEEERAALRDAVSA
ncbi:hypothetical protein LX81_02478 [Palleronia aestuarii]|uniref:Flavin-dependent dehydrogenase n=1 Tax=Palleronia aestuarii TaxID=568105 RepID=A0A2W7N603_9RHOB|nr:hypothetical protein LX81_02478 [Palleronia aestuarii]